jgi:hypothetical protein
LELLLAKQEEMLAEMKADRKPDQEKAEANWKNLKEMMKTKKTLNLAKQRWDP